MKSKLALVSIREDAAPAAFHERAAAGYLGMNRLSFRELLKKGIIPYTMHLNGKTRIYLRSDLDAYLQRLPRYKMPSRENPLKAVKGGSR